MDADHDGRISRREFDAYYRLTEFERVRIVAQPDRGDAALSETLFRLLDTDGDGRLSMEELKGAAAALQRVDLNEDEWITPDEILVSRASGHRQGRGRRDAGGDGSRPARSRGIDRSAAPHDPRSLREDDQAGWRRAGGAPEAAAGTGIARPPRNARPGTGAHRGPSSANEAGRGRGRQHECGRGRPSLDLGSRSDSGPIRGLHEFYRQQFDAADGGSRGFVERSDLDDAPTLAALFRLADRDGDGKLTRKELDTFLDLHLAGASSFVSLAVTDQSIGLFDLIDEDHDGRLSLRELFTARTRLASLDRNKDGFIGRDEFPHRLHFRMALGKPVPPLAAKARPAPRPIPPRGPAWFRKMDRNGDGYVSRREFLGSEELFQKLDTDGDGLISPEEAEQLKSD